MFSLFQHFVFSLSLLFFEKNIFFAFWGFILCFYFFLNFFFYYFHFFSGELKYVRVWGLNKAKSKKPCKKSIFFLPNQNVICKYDE